MSSPPPASGSQPPAPPQYAPPPGPPPGSAPPPGQTAPHDPNAPAAAAGSSPQSSYAPPPGAPPGQQPYPPPGAPGAYPGYPYYQGYYAPPPPPGQYPGYPGYYPPPPGAYPPPPGAYPPPHGSPGGYPPPGGPPAAGGHPPPAGATPDTRAYSPQPGGPAPGAYQPPLGAPPSAGGYGLPPGGYAPPPGAPGTPGGYPYPAYGQYPALGMAPSPGFPSAPPAGPSGAGYYPPPPPLGQYGVPTVGAPGAADPLWYLGSPIPDPNSPPAAHGVQKVPGYDPAPHFLLIQKAAAADIGLEANVISTLLSLDVYKMNALSDFAVAKSGKKLENYMDKFSSANFSPVARALTLGPLGYDVELANKALVGFGTNEMLLTELILGRPSPEIRLLKMGYKLRYGKDLVDVAKSDLSGKQERMFVMALNAQRPPDTLMVDHTQVASDIERLNTAAKKRDEMGFLEVLINRSNPHLQAVITGYGSRYKSLSKVIKKTFSGNMEVSLLYIIHGVKAKRDGQGYWRDAKLLEKSMAGMGTRDSQLIYRLVRAHWDPARLEQIKEAYQRRYNKPLLNRIKGETSGPYRDILLAIVNGSGTVKMPSAK